MANGALSDFRVIEYGHYISGPWCAKHFAAMGAEVIKVEPPEGDSARRFGPFPGDVPHPEKSGLFLYLNTSKLGVTLDVKHPRGKAIFLELVKGADILIENNPPRVMEELGLTYETLREVNSRLIMTSITWFGQTGPYRDYKGSDLVCFQMGGVGYETPTNYVTDPENEHPLRGGGHQADLTAGWLGAVGTMVAVMHRLITGEGQHVDISEQEAVASTVRPNVTLYSYQGQLKSRLKEGVAYCIPCKDGYVTINTGTPSRWENLVRAMGDPEWAQTEAFRDRAQRTQNWQAVEVLLGEWASQYTKAEIFRMALEYSFMCFPLNTMEDLFNSDHYAAREMFVPIEHPIAGKHLYPREPFLLSGTPWRLGGAPCLGEHNEEVYCGQLGYSRQDLVRLRQAGVI